jgi:hypothetical protein
MRQPPAIVKPTRMEAKVDATTKAVREILDKETAITDAKTERLRAMRLAREAAPQPASAPAKKKKAARP